MNKLISIDDSDLDLVSGGGTGADIGSAVGGAVGGAVDKAAGVVGEVVEGVVHVATKLIPKIDINISWLGKRWF